MVSIAPDSPSMSGMNGYVFERDGRARSVGTVCGRIFECFELGYFCVLPLSAHGLNRSRDAIGLW